MAPLPKLGIVSLFLISAWVMLVSSRMAHASDCGHALNTINSASAELTRGAGGATASDVNGLFDDFSDRLGLKAADVQNFKIFYGTEAGFESSGAQLMIVCFSESVGYDKTILRGNDAVNLTVELLDSHGFGWVADYVELHLYEKDKDFQRIFLTREDCYWTEWGKYAPSPPENCIKTALIWNMWGLLYFSRDGVSTESIFDVVELESNFRNGANQRGGYEEFVDYLKNFVVKFDLHLTNSGESQKPAQEIETARELLSKAKGKIRKNGRLDETDEAVIRNYYGPGYRVDPALPNTSGWTFGDAFLNPLGGAAPLMRAAPPANSKLHIEASYDEATGDDENNSGVVRLSFSAPALRIGGNTVHVPHLVKVLYTDLNGNEYEKATIVVSGEGGGSLRFPFSTAIIDRGGAEGPRKFATARGIDVRPLLDAYYMDEKGPLVCPEPEIGKSEGVVKNADPWAKTQDQWSKGTDPWSKKSDPWDKKRKK